MVQTFRDAMDYRVLQPVVMQHDRIDERGQLRLATNDVFRLGAHAFPDRVERGKLCALRIDLML